MIRTENNPFNFSNRILIDLLFFTILTDFLAIVRILFFIVNGFSTQPQDFKLFILSFDNFHWRWNRVYIVHFLCVNTKNVCTFSNFDFHSMRRKITCSWVNLYSHFDKQTTQILVRGVRLNCLNSTTCWISRHLLHSDKHVISKGVWMGQRS